MTTMEQTVSNENECDPDERLTLLIRKHTQKTFSVEDEARLEFLTEEMRRIYPRVIHSDFERLSEIIEANKRDCCENRGEK